MIMIDLQKAFNTINHQILTTNFQRREYAIFNVYNRILREENNLAYISRGVPQVIYIDPYFICYYVNDMFISTKLKQYISSVCR
jgi:hypothetical protein